MKRFFIFCYIIFIGTFVHGQNADYTQYAPVGAEKCMRVLGCFKITEEFFDMLRRPVNLLPQDRSVVNTQFHLYTNSNPSERYILDADDESTLQSSPLKADHPTKFIIHGYIDKEGHGRWHEHLKDKYLLRGKHNVVIVDWSGGNTLPYTQASANARVVGAEIAYLIKKLQIIKNLRPENCHIIGHSLGAHVCGYAGERIPNLGRITGLDPAEPYFQYLHPSVRLDETDAQFVDIVHTDSKSILLLGLGMDQSIGHIDFYPNNGRDQPGCGAERIIHLIIDGISEGGRRSINCNHNRAIDFYMYSIIRDKCLPVGYNCESWDDFLDAKCTDCGQDGRKCAILGDKAILSKGLNQTNMKLYLKMDKDIPYCLEQYEVIIKLHRGKNSKDVRGKLDIVINGDKDDLEATLAKTPILLFPGSRYNFLITSNKELGKMKSILVRWMDPLEILNPLNWFNKPKINIQYIKVIPMNIIDASARTEQTGIFCPVDPEKPIYSGKETALTLREDCRIS